MFKMHVRQNWNEVGRIHNVAKRYLLKNKFSPTSAARVTMTVCELVENALKYGFFQHPRDRVKATIVIEPGMVTVQVTNHFNKDCLENLREFDRTIQWVRGFHDPFEAYMERIKAIAQEVLNLNRSKLGIARIAYEGRAALDFYIENAYCLTVSAVLPR